MKSNERMNVKQFKKQHSDQAGNRRTNVRIIQTLSYFTECNILYIGSFQRYLISTFKKQGRAAMLGFLHVIAIEAGVRLPGYLSVSQDLKFSDVPAGCFASLEAVPTAGWLQIMVLT